MEELIGTLADPSHAIVLSLIFILGDILSSLLCYWKNRNLTNTSIRIESICKLGWLVGLLLGYMVMYVTNINLLLLVIAGACIGTELRSVLENLAEIGVKIPLKKYIKKMQKWNNS